MRTIKELLQLMLDNPQYFKNGLCLWVQNMYYKGKITKIERILLDDYIEENKPSVLSSLKNIPHVVLSSNYPAYYWKKGDIKPRIKWLKKHIKKN